MKRRHIKLSKHPGARLSYGFNSVWSSSLESAGVLCWMLGSLISWLEQWLSFLRDPLSHVSGFVLWTPQLCGEAESGRHCRSSQCDLHTLFAGRPNSIPLPPHDSDIHYYQTFNTQMAPCACSGLISFQSLKPSMQALPCAVSWPERHGHSERHSRGLHVFRFTS